MTNVKVQVAPVSHPPTQFMKEMGGSSIAGNQVWDIRGSFTQHQCSRSTMWDNTYAQTHNCSQTDMSTAKGSCYKNSFGDWKCEMSDMQHVGINPRAHTVPPEGN